MPKPGGNLQPSQSALVARVDEIRESLKQIPVTLLVERTGASYQAIGPGRGEFRLSLVDSPLIITFPDFRIFDAQDNESPPFIQALVIYYLETADGTRETGRWISFADLPDGRVYASAFQGYTGDDLVKTLGLDVEALRTACEKLGGTPRHDYGDAAYVIWTLPRIPLLVNYWCGDEDFPSTCKLLFDESVSHYLPTEVCAILGSTLTRRILKQR